MYTLKLNSSCLNKIIFIALFLFIGNYIFALPDITIIKLPDSTKILINPEPDTDYYGLQLKLSGEGQILLQNEKEQAEYRFSTGGKAESIYFYKSLTHFLPSKIIISSTMNYDVFSANIIPEKNELPPLADIGHIIFSDFTGDTKGWNVYRWNLSPDILIYDTADYAVQSKLFKRLAFFVEKPGFIGKLVSNKDLANRHGWNAHDYKPDDLAAFFTKAKETGFQLNPEEIALKDLIIKCGIIIKQDNKYIEGHGAVLSASRETNQRWRYRFLTHECFHGIFFTNDDYRKEITETFYALSPDEINFWKHLLDYRRYDVTNEYLLVNEFMAYSLQQPLEETDDYFKGFLYKRMVVARPYEKDLVETFDAAYPESFVNSAKALEKILHSYTGREAGHLANLYPANITNSFYDLFAEF
ncbi:MAG: hypothetical protein PQJ46_06275 [Spirochaetales bacterium]|nr:hypothetical protein [Spirochaetales bacterium]